MERWKFKDSYTGDEVVEEHERMEHPFRSVSFIEFANNSLKRSDLSKYKALIDLYDKVKSGFTNDLEDIILENYGVENLGEFLGDLKRYKAVKTENDGSGGGGGVKTIQIEIPVEDRKVILEMLKKHIYESGQGLQQDVEYAGNASGVALTNLLQTEFESAYNKLVRAILKCLSIYENKNISQTWTRNMISNDLENAQIARVSKGIIPDELI